MVAANMEPGDAVEGLEVLATEQSLAAVAEDEYVAHAALLQELASSDAQLAPTLRAVYDGGEAEAFKDALDKYIARADAEIEKLCSNHYKGFAESVNELLLVRQSAASLSTDVAAMQEELEETSTRVVSKAEEMIEHRHILRNIMAALEALSACLPVLHTYGKAMECLQSKEYYQSLKALAQLEQRLPKLEGLELAKLLAENVPAVRGQIKDAVKADLQTWLETNLKTATRTGEVAIWTTAKEYYPEQLPTVEKWFTGAEDEQADHAADYKALYRCRHIYEVLDLRHEFESFYVDSRLKQATLIMDLPNPQLLGRDGAFDRLKNYLSQILGFILVEDFVMSTTQNMLSTSVVDDMCRLAVEEIAKNLRKALPFVKDRKVLSSLKLYLRLFASTLSGYGYSSASFMEVLYSVRERYDKLVMAEWQKKFDTILVEDDFKPVVVQSRAEWDALATELNLEDKPDWTFPRTLGFSSSVPKLYRTIKDFYPEIMDFFHGLDLSNTQVDEFTRMSGYVMFTEHLKASFESVLKRAVEDYDLNVIVQLAINAAELRIICRGLEPYIAKLTNTTAFIVSEGDQLGRVAIKTAQGVVREKIHSGRVVLEDIRKRADSYIGILQHKVIDDYITPATYDWITTKPRDVPSESMEMLVQKLTNMFARLDALPGMTTDQAHESTCKYLALKLLGLITALPTNENGTVYEARRPQPSPMDLPVFQELELDIVLCDGFADACAVPYLRDVFDPVRELVHLFRQPRPEAEFRDVKIRSEKYKHVKAHDVMAVIDRLSVDIRRGNAGGGLFNAPSNRGKRWEYFRVNLNSMIQNERK